MDQLDPVYIALVTFRRREFETCIDVCTGILDRNPYDEAVWSLKTRALTAQVKETRIICSFLDSVCIIFI